MAQPFAWQECWYPVVFVVDFPADRPYGFSVFGKAFVLYRSGGGRLVCADDQCPHRMARLSDGRLYQGQLECLYHGWRFDGDGECVVIPQLPAEQSIPRPACLKTHPVMERQGIIWIWPGAAELADPGLIPTTSALDEPGVVSVDYAIDLPYDQSYLIENVIDVAHIHIVHHGVRGGGLRELAKPLAFDIISNTARGITGTFRSVGSGVATEASKINNAVVEYVAPNLIRYTSNYKNTRKIAGLALYSLPIAPGKCRLLYRKYSNFYAWRERWKPRWLEHWTQNLILRQDMALLVGQYSGIQKSGENLKDLWLPLKSSDILVLAYRQWLDVHGQDLPYYRGYKTFRNPEDVDYGLDALCPALYDLHTRNCRACHDLHQHSCHVRNVAICLALVLLPLGWFVKPGAVAVGYLMLLGVGATAEALRRRCE